MTTEPPPGHPAVETQEVHRIRLVEAPVPPQTPEERRAVDHAWEEAVRANPDLFDGPVVACTRLTRTGPHDVTVSWARTTYRRYARRRGPGATPGLPALFVAVVQPAEDGRLLVGRMASWTATPGRWQLPGGSIEPPAPHQPLDTAALQWHAARELAEETGVDTPPDDLALWLVLRGARGSVGVVFRAPERPARGLRERHAALVSAEAERGRGAEFDRVQLVGSAEELARLGETCATYLAPVVHRYGRS
ncbi:NUDIX hydrolase [Streptomyces sp. WZ-12]|uniref:NUDIX hydrolase n=1 Tax=Streptomyces sp. WZ-12 TaxID=3030210 RepID=UPI00238153F3|nr:NUDIX hydrolase [Streptomyces sp. WZ-12]